MKIIKRLVIDDTPLRDQDIAMLNNCSLATARTDINTVAKKYGDTFGVSLREGRIQFTNRNLSTASRTFRLLFDESTRMKMLFEIFSKPHQNRQYYCQLHSISEASFYRAISDINDVLEKHQFMIKYNKGGYYLEAVNELHLRRFMVSLLTETKAMEEIFTRIPFESIMQLVIGHLFMDLPIEYDMYYSYYSYYAYVSLIRETQGFVGLKTNNQLEEFPEYKTLKPYFPNLEHKHLASIRKSFYQQLKPWKNEVEKQQLLFAFDYFISEFSKFTDEVFNEKTYRQLLFVSILTYGNFQIYPKDYTILFNRVDIFIMQFKRSNYDIYEEFNKILKKTEGFINQPLDHMADQLLFWIQLLCPRLYLAPAIAKVKIFSDLGKEHQIFYKEIFSTLLNDLIILEDNDPSQPDFIISNYDLVDVNTEVLYIRDYPLSEDLFRVYELMKYKTRNNQS